MERKWKILASGYLFFLGCSPVSPSLNKGFISGPPDEGKSGFFFGNATEPKAPEEIFPDTKVISTKEKDTSIVPKKVTTISSENASSTLEDPILEFQQKQRIDLSNPDVPKQILIEVDLTKDEIEEKQLSEKYKVSLLKKEDETGYILKTHDSVQPELDDVVKSHLTKIQAVYEFAEIVEETTKPSPEPTPQAEVTIVTIEAKNNALGEQSGVDATAVHTTTTELESEAN